MARKKLIPFEEPHTRELRVFHDVARALVSNLDLESVLGNIMDQMATYYKPDQWSFLLVDEKRGDLCYAIAGGDAGLRLRNVRVPLGEGISGWVAAHGEVLIAAGHDERIQELTRRYPGTRVQSAVGLPVRSRQKTLGVIELINARLESLPDYSVLFLYVLCDYAAIAIENSRAVSRIHQLTITDDVTGLYNARHMYTLLERELENAQQTRTSVSLVFIDLDHFKQVNDTKGHLVGTRLLTEIGQTIQARLGPNDAGFRYGGDEFVLLLANTDKGRAMEAARDLLHTFHTHNYLQSTGFTHHVKASMGVATFPDDGADLQEIMKAADTAMYSVKASTRNDVAAAAHPAN